MIIRKLTVQNIRSHLNSEIEFKEGFNCIVGGVGSGKTSILLSIHFALFGEPLYRSYDYLLRDDKTRGQVVLEFEHAGKLYRIMRTLKRERGRTSQDTGNLQLSVDGANIAYGKLTAVLEQLKSIIGIAPRMFEEFIWIQQERLKEILNVPPSERQSILDDFLGFSSFQKAVELLLPYQRRYEGVKTTLEKDLDVIGLTGLKTQYEEILSSIVTLQVDVEDSKFQLKEAEINLKQAEENLKHLESLAKRIDSLKEEKSSLSSNLSETNAYVNSLELQINKKINEANKGKKLLNTINSGLKGTLSELSKSSLTELIETLERLDADITEFRKIKSEAEIRIEKVRNAMITITGESVCPTCKKELEQSYKQKLLGQFEKEGFDARKTVEEFADRLKKMELDRKTLSNAKNKVEILGLQAEEQRKLNESIEEELAKIRSELAEKEKTQKLIQIRLASVENEISKFKVEDVENARKIHMDCLLKFRSLRDDVKNKDILIKEKEASLNLVEAKIKDAEDKLRRKQHVDSIINIISVLRSAYKDVVPALRKTYIESLSQAVQSVIDSLISVEERNFYVEMDEAYTPILVEETGLKREAGLLSGGERTWLAFAYRIGLGQLIMEARTGQNLELLLLDEPTEALGSEDGSIEALASAIANLKAIRQVITVTHSEELARKASHRIFVSKKEGVSRVIMETGY